MVRRNRDPFDRDFDNVDVEYKKYLDEKRKKGEVEYRRVKEIQQDLFAMSKEYSLAHCVAEDMRMGSGIAVTFKRDFKDIDELFSQRQKQGGLAVLSLEDRYIYYLVTKRVSNGKPTYETLWSSLKKLRDHMKEYSVEKLAIPRLGCGLDRLEWTHVKNMIEFLFKELEVEITVCNFQQPEDSPEKPQNITCKVVHVEKPIADIEEETSIIYLSSVDGHVSTEMEQLSKKFAFLSEFKKSPKNLGDVITYKMPKRFYVLKGCIVRKTKNDLFDFKSFRNCVQQISRDCKKEQYVYVAFQAIKDDQDDLINDKIITILKNYMRGVDVYICWDGDLVKEMPSSARE
ncbi:hypothetical protein NQ318_006744 [Aromia moschata]|uniref:Macro domain-containing protein n=1 Tax=Aromia moschata TaxID=1265417 RepID=A0AAV8YDT2_9CUCU|nr:hypothetical protein NQ318_006744 [Aromia moschata]